MATAYIFLNGDFDPQTALPTQPEPGSLVLAADGGGRHALALGWPVHVLVGDFDSLSKAELETIEAGGAEIVRHPTEKDEIDFELTLNMALAKGFKRFVVLAALGGRWDMTMANLFLPSPFCPPETEIIFRQGPWNIRAVCAPLEVTIEGAPGDLLSLIPLSGDAAISLSGCRYPLSNETIAFGLTRGLSNELSAAQAHLRLWSGSVLSFHRRTVV